MEFPFKNDYKNALSLFLVSLLAHNFWHFFHSHYNKKLTFNSNSQFGVVFVYSSFGGSGWTKWHPWWQLRETRVLDIYEPLLHLGQVVARKKFKTVKKRTHWILDFRWDRMLLRQLTTREEMYHFRLANVLSQYLCSDGRSMSSLAKYGSGPWAVGACWQMYFWLNIRRSPWWV